MTKTAEISITIIITADISIRLGESHPNTLFSLKEMLSSSAVICLALGKGTDQSNQAIGTFGTSLNTEDSNLHTQFTHSISSLTVLLLPTSARALFGKHGNTYIS